MILRYLAKNKLPFLLRQRVKNSIPVVEFSPFEKGGSRGIYLKIIPQHPSFSKRGTEYFGILFFASYLM
jgi:hypothetical protein